MGMRVLVYGDGRVTAFGWVALVEHDRSYVCMMDGCARRLTTTYVLVGTGHDVPCCKAKRCWPH